MQENISLTIVLPLVNAGEYFVSYCQSISECWKYLLAIVMPLVNAGEYFVVYCQAISECWRIFCWLLSCH